MKVIHFIGSIDKSAGGTATYLQMIAAELKSKIKLVVVTGLSPNPLIMEGLRIFQLDLNVFRWFRLKEEFSNILKSENPDLVHINGIWDPQNYLFQKIAQSLKIKTLISPHGMLEPYILNRNPIKKKIALYLYQRDAIRKANYLHATAQTELDQIRRLGFASPTIVIPNGIDISEIKEYQKRRSSGPLKNILFLSRIHPKKGIEVLIESIEKLPELNIKVMIAGEGEPEYVQRLEELIKRKKLTSKISFLGGVYGKDKWNLYKKADLFVLPTYSENFGIVIIEALAAGVPVITTKGTPWQELETFNCGWWIELSSENLAKTIRTACNLSGTQLKIMGENGRNLVKNKYEIKAVSEDTMSFYETIICE